MALLETAEPPAYQKIALRARRLHELWLSLSAIAKHLGVTDKTAAAICWIGNDTDLAPVASTGIR